MCGVRFAVTRLEGTGGDVRAVATEEEEVIEGALVLRSIGVYLLWWLRVNTR